MFNVERLVDFIDPWPELFLLGVIMPIKKNNNNVKLQLLDQKSGMLELGKDISAAHILCLYPPLNFQFIHCKNGVQNLITFLNT